MKLILSPQGVEQPPLFTANCNELTVAIASLSIGGAERIVLDWARRIYPEWRVHLIVLRNREKEWPVPSFIRVTRVEQSIGPRDNFHTFRLAKLRDLGAELKKHPIPTCTCHLLNKEERDALGSSGAEIVTVLHNAKEGWPEGPASFGWGRIIAVSEACADELRRSGCRQPVSVVRHIPLPTHFSPHVRASIRRSWNIPENAMVIGMIGAVKSQKNYSRALHILKSLLTIRDAYLVIVGGPLSGIKGRKEWETVLQNIHSLGLRNRVAMPGFIPDSSTYLPAFDLLLNTSDFEGLSMATLEALQCGLPVVASAVGGQGEIQSPGLQLLNVTDSDETWAHYLDASLGKRHEQPAWSYFKSHRLWTMSALARNIGHSENVLFVTANLNVGGAQRSLVNLARNLKGLVPFKIAVAGNSTDSYFFEQLREARVDVVRLTDNHMSFNNAEALISLVCSEKIRTICFWNLDPKIKLLVIKSLGFTDIRFVDVSPGDNSFDELASQDIFQNMIAYSDRELYARLDTIVTKYKRQVLPNFFGKLEVIRNGVPPVENYKVDYSISGAPRIVINGRIAPTKFLLEIIESMKFVRRSFPSAELHIFGAAESTHKEYAEAVFNAASKEVAVFFKGLNFEASRSLKDYDVYVVIGKDQGCPNALLEAMAVGMPCVANNDGGTSEQLRDGKTGLLIKSRLPSDIAVAVIRLLENRKLAEKLGKKARKYVLTKFSMDLMTANYLKLFSASTQKKSFIRNLSVAFKNGLTFIKNRGTRYEDIESCTA
jgi:glycosyltransferase involved in cell wall biosynthesis